MDQRKVKIGVNLLKEVGIFSIQEVQKDQDNLESNIKKRSKLSEGTYIKKINEEEVYVVTKVLAKRVMKELHEIYGHMGSRKLWLMFRETYVCRKDVSIAKEITSRCELCQLGKDKNRINENEPKTIIAKECLEIIAIDFLSNLIESYDGKKHILVIVDIFSKFTRLYPCKRTNFKEIKLNLERYFEQFGKPKRCIIDNATYFRNRRFENFCKKNDLRMSFTSIRHPAANPSERYIKEIIKYLRIVTFTDHQNWENHLEEVQGFLNNVPHTNTEDTPVYIMTKIKPERPWEFRNKTNYEVVLEQVNKRIQ